MAFDRHVQPASRSSGQPRQVAFGAAQLWQQAVGQLQQAQTGTGEAHGAGLAYEKLQAQTLFQFLELVRKCRLGQMQTLGGFHQTVRFAQGMKGPQMTNFQHAGASCAV